MDLSTLALKLCSIDSPIGHEGPLADEVEKWARAHFPPEQVFRHSHSLVLGAQEDARPSIALIGHLDTVPAHPGLKPPRIEGDRLYGLGSADMKGGLAVMMKLAESLPRASLACNLMLVLYEREEGPYLESGLTELFEKIPALSRLSFGIAMEPTDNVVQVGCVGSLHATLRVEGKAAHSARPWQGENAVHKAGPLLAELLSRARKEVDVAGHTFFEVMNVTLAKGGRARNVVPDEMELNLNYRFAPGKSLEQAQEDVVKWVAGRARVEFTDLAPSGRVCADNRYFQRLVKELPVAAKQAWTDVARFSERGVDAVNFGPGETAQAHQVNESSSVHALQIAYERLETFFSTL